jgi:hypothetical protein
MVKPHGMAPIDTRSRLRADLEIGLRELDAGLGKELDIEDVIRQARREIGHEQGTDKSRS